jgi:hypothetical protein
MAEAKKPQAAITLEAAATKLGSEGGKRGGPARAKALTPARRSAIAKMGGKARQARAKKKLG